MRVYLDNCCFNRPFDDQSQMRIKLESEAKLEIQDRIRKGQLELAWSYILDLENSANPFDDRKNAIAEWRDLAKRDTNETPEIIASATELQSQGLKEKDSLHLGCAITLECDQFFTTDEGILKKRSLISEIAVLNPVEYIMGN